MGLCDTRFPDPAAAEQSRISAAQHIFRSQDVYGYAHDPIGGRAG
jgi:hypothetical protein